MCEAPQLVTQKKVLRPSLEEVTSVHEQIQDAILFTTQAPCLLYIVICMYLGGKQNKQTIKLPMYRALQQQ